MGIDLFKKWRAQAVAEERARDGTEVASGPIVACVGSEESFDTGDRERLASLGAEIVDYYASAELVRSREQRSGGANTYVISSISDTNKKSEEFRDCSSLVLIGKERDSGNNISILTHQDPSFLFGRRHGREAFVHDLDEVLASFASRTEPGSVDAVIVGGNSFKESIDRDDQSPEVYEKRYIDSVTLLGERVRTTFGVDPRVIAGPNMNAGDTSVILDTHRRRLYVCRPEQPTLDHSFDFNASDVEGVVRDGNLPK